MNVEGEKREKLNKTGNIKTKRDKTMSARDNMKLMVNLSQVCFAMVCYFEYFEQY